MYSFLKVREVSLTLLFSPQYKTQVFSIDNQTYTNTAKKHPSICSGKHIM